MKSSSLFLLVYLLGSLFGGTNTQSSVTCARRESCDLEPDATSHFLQCVGLPSTDTGKDHMQRLKGMLEATMDVYSFLKSSMTGVPFLSLDGALDLNPHADPLQNEALVQMWLEIKIKPLLKSITKHFLSCLSTKNFSCSTYQTVVMELSHHYSEMNPVRQKWIYMFFMYPFLSGDRVAGCVNPEESSEEWLMKNFGAFRAMARMKDLSALNMVFSGLEVLHLLSPAQKAELLLSPELESLDNGTLTLVFHNLLTGGSDPPPTVGPGEDHGWTSPDYSTMAPSPPPQPTQDSYMPSPQDKLREVVNGFMMAFKPIGSFAHEFVSFTQQRNMSEIRSTTLTQFLLNFTLAELADMYRPKNTTVPETPQFDVTNVEDWYQQVVVPLLQRFLPNDAHLMHPNITLAFHQVFFLDYGMVNDTTELLDVCSITLDKNVTHCGLTNAVENMATVLHCAAKTNLTMTETTIMRLIEELTKRLNTLIKELSTANFKEVVSDFQGIFSEEHPSPDLTQENLEDPAFIKLWFQIKLLPLLPDVNPDLLSCLSTKNFSCPVYQTLVEELGKLMSVMDADLMYSNNIYQHFIYSFLMHHNTSDPQCVFSANNSAEWLTNNFGFFSRFASITDFYKLNPHFSGMEALHLLSPKQLAEMLLLPLPTPPEKDVVIDSVFDFLSEPSQVKKFPEVLHFLVQLAEEVNPPCSVYKQIFVRLYGAIQSLSPQMEPVFWASIDDLINIAPQECVPENITCPETQANGTICKNVDSSDLQSYMNMSMHFPCNFTLEKYACAQLNFTASQLAALLRCNLPGNSSHAHMLWKILLTKYSYVLDPALDMLVNMSVGMLGPSAQEILDVIGEIRLSMLTDGQLTDSDILRLWFSSRLSGFLPSASGRFLHCLSSRNVSCSSYQQILKAFNHQFEDMSLQQQLLILKNFVLRFLSRPLSGPGCVLTSNGSAVWLWDNWGPFSRFVSVETLLYLNPHFNPLEALQFLTPNQSAELLVLTSPSLPNKDIIINILFDYFTESPKERKLTEFLSYLVTFLEKGNLSCSSYRTLFTRLDLAMTTASLDIASSITDSKVALSKHVPPGCIIYSGQCNVTMTNETDICTGVNSTGLQLRLDTGKMTGHFCDFAVKEFACASLSALTAQDLVTILRCNRSSNSSGSIAVWKLLLSKTFRVLDETLDLVTSSTLDPSSPSVSMILDSIREIRLDTISTDILNDPTLIQLWFNQRLRPFLPAVSPAFLSCFATKDLHCSAYQQIVQILSEVQPHMTPATQMSVNTYFIKASLTRNNTADPFCSLNVNNSGEWLQKNLGGFSILSSFLDLQKLYPKFSPMEALPQLTVIQLAEVSATPGQLTSSEQVAMVMSYIPNQQLASFFDVFSPATMGHENMFPLLVRSAMLEVVFDRANLSDPSVEDSVVLDWLHRRLRPLLVNLSPSYVTPFFRILAGRNCSTGQQGVETLNMTISTLSEDTQTEIHNHIIQALEGPSPLRCYGDNYNHSFYIFLMHSFMGFQFPNLTTFMSLMPLDRMHLLLNSIPVAELADFLRRPNVVDNEAQLCVLYNNYDLTPVFLETETLPAVVMRPTLPCIWPKALSNTSRSEVNTWFDRSLKNYMPFLTKSLISPSVTYNASCMAFQKLVIVLGEYNYTAADFVKEDVFNTIRAYLTSVTTPRCYDPSQAVLNSTAWFVEYIGPFMPFLTLETLQSFGSEQVLQVFAVNQLNIALFNQFSLPLNLTSYYTQLIYQQDSNFNPLLLPMLCRCFAPGPAFVQLTAEQSIIVLHNLTTLCTDLDPQVSAALASNFGTSIDSTVITSLSNQSTGLSMGQLKMISPQDLFFTLNILSSVTGWRPGQAMAILQSLMSSGMMQINSSSSFLMLGSLLSGIPSYMLNGISGSQLLIASQNSLIMTYLMSASQTVHQTFVTKIISVSSSSDMMIQNVPDQFATEIPRVTLQGFSSSLSVVTELNKKTWKREQVELFFNSIAVETATAYLGGPQNLSSYMLQGFTCTGVRTINSVQIKELIKACRRSGKTKVKLVETQLTCMYNYIRGDSDVTSFNLYPSDVLLYYDYSLVPQARCRSYFQQLADADFSVFSSVLSYKRTALFNNARSCLGITNTSLTKDVISVLGNMCCMLDGSYIQNSDPLILEKLKNCPDLTDAQAAAVQSLLTSGKTNYSAPSSWNGQTLVDLGMLPLYLSSSFYDNFSRKIKQNFLRYFLTVIKSNGVDRKKRAKFNNAIIQSIKRMSKRSLATDCTVGMITQVTINDPTFLLNYVDINQFNNCLSATTVKENLDVITENIDDKEYLKIVLSKLREAYISTIPEDQVQMLSAASRLATIVDINMWNITQIDTLAALMNSANGEWDPSLAKAIISKYLSVKGNKLGSAELNSIGGTNLCSLDVDVLRNISQESLKNAQALDLSNCTTEKQQEMFSIASQAFVSTTRSSISVSSYQLTQPYLSGASLDYVRSLATSNVSMDLATFSNLNANVLLNLTVDEVKGLLGTNLPDLKSYENQTLVQTWITRQFQSALDTLGLGIQGGRADPVTTNTPTANSSNTNSSNANTTSPSTANTTAPTTPTTTPTTPPTTSPTTTPTTTPTATPTPTTTPTTTKATGNGFRIQADAGFSILVFLALIITSHHIII